MTKKLCRDVRHLMICHSFALRNSDFVVFPFETEPERTLVLFVDIGRGRRRCRSQKRSILVFVVQRFDWDGAPDFGRFLILRLDWNCFSDLWSGFGCLSTGPASADVRCFHCTVSGSGQAVGLWTCGCFRCWLRRRLRFQRWLKRIVRILIG